MGFNSADYIHTVIEAEKLALADRDEYYGDPNFVKRADAAVALRSIHRNASQADRSEKGITRIRPGDPYTMKPTKPPTITGPWHGGTTVMCVTDKFGNVIAATPSGLSSTAGVAGRTGIIHGSRLSSLNTFAGTPNVIQAGKRPRITLSPTLLFHDNQPVMAISVAGGDMQDQAAIQVILDYVEFGMSPEDAFKAPRFSTTHFISSFGQDAASLGSLSVPNTLPEAVQADLRARGHAVTSTRGGVGGVALIVIDPKTRAGHRRRSGGWQDGIDPLFTPSTDSKTLMTRRGCKTGRARFQAVPLEFRKHAAFSRWGPTLSPATATNEASSQLPAIAQELTVILSEELVFAPKRDPQEDERAGSIAPIQFSFGASHNSIRFPSGSMIHANRP